MAQSALTVTPPNPTPPTNFSFTGVTGPNPPNYTKNTMNDPRNWAANPPAPTYPPPFYDDGSAGAGTAFAANTAALAGGSGATAGGTENTYPGIGGLSPPAPNMGGAVPASTSAAHEGAGTEVVVTQTYPATIFNPAGPLVTCSAGAAVTNVANPPNGAHASSLSPATALTVTSIGTNNTASGAGTVSQTVTGTGFTRQSVIYVNGVAQTTTYVSSTSLTAPTVTKKATAGTWPVTVVTAGAVAAPTPVTWTFI
jgi:hypothetical protein